MAESISLVRVADVPPGTMRRVTADGRTLLVLNVGGDFVVVGNECPHAGAPLHQGPLNGCVLTCPWHGSQFDLCAGSLVRGPATVPLLNLPADVVDGWVVLAR
jgi:nitrite reductase (NADH) small subunit/3-phenylpropionate/trans-cinnamate dioxygenase ferredoxin subunit